MAVVNSFAKFCGAVYPATSDVLASAPVYGDPINVLQGTYTGGSCTGYPAQSDVLAGVVYGDTSQYTGSLDVDLTANLPTESEVISGVAFGSSSQFTGNVTQPGVSDVRIGIQYGANGNQYTGTLSTSSNVTLPAIGEVLNGVSYGDVASPIVGVFVSPQISDVVSGVTYGANGSQFTGSFQCDAYGIQNETKVIVRGDDAVIEWVSDGSWSAAGSILFGIVGSTGALQVAGTVVNSTTVRATLTSTQTDALRDVYDYDVQMTDNGAVSHLVQGSLIVKDTETDIPANDPMPQARPI